MLSETYGKTVCPIRKNQEPLPIFQYLMPVAKKNHSPHFA